MREIVFQADAAVAVGFDGDTVPLAGSAGLIRPPGWSEPPDETCSKETFTVTPQAGMGKV